MWGYMGDYIVIVIIMENQMEKKMENEMETIIMGSIGWGGIGQYFACSWL